MKISSIVGVAAAAMLLAACGDAGGAGPIVTVTAGPGASPGGPAPTVTVTVAGAPDDYPEYDYDRLFNIHIGDTHASASSAMGYPITGESICPWVSFVVMNQNIDFYASALTRVDDPLGTPFDTFLMRYYGDINADYVFPKNAEDIGIGSTVAELQAAYPTMYATDPNSSYEGISFYVVEGPNGNNYRFYAPDGRVTVVFWGPGISLTPGDICAL